GTRLRPKPLLARRHPPGLTGGHYALGVGMAPARAVALGDDEHVLREGGEIADAERTGVRGGLAVLSPTDRPPTDGLRFRHPSKHVTRAHAVSIVASVEHQDTRIVV